MNVEFTSEELTLLEEVVGEHIEDLRIEIANTDDFTFRQGLKRKSELLKLILAKCEQSERMVAN